MEIEVTTKPVETDSDAILQGLREHNTCVEKLDKKPFSLFIRDDTDAVIAGLNATSYWQWTVIDDVWVHEKERGKGHGRRLVEKAEELAKEHGNIGVQLGTGSWQAPDFYPRLGYIKCGEIQDFPPGHSQIQYYKKF